MQTHINLLPWRETLKKEREIRFYSLIGVSLFLTGLVILAVHLYMEDLISYQGKRNNYINVQIKQAEDKIKEIEDLDQKKTTSHWTDERYPRTRRKTSSNRAYL
ncbi:Fimbrial assembly [Beggiatoa sp. PS]|nr:Fimbrial assembly [Beggiatoa sp. PS]